MASEDVDMPLYPWQIYSIIGREGCHHIVHAFYSRVYADTEVRIAAPLRFAAAFLSKSTRPDHPHDLTCQDTHFRDAFANIFNFDHHVDTQTDFWADAFGGGKLPTSCF